MTSRFLGRNLHWSDELLAVGCRWLIGTGLAIRLHCPMDWSGHCRAPVLLAHLLHDGSDTCINCAMFGGSVDTSEECRTSCMAPSAPGQPGLPELSKTKETLCRNHGRQMKGGAGGREVFVTVVHRNSAIRATGAGSRGRYQGICMEGMPGITKETLHAHKFLKKLPYISKGP